MPASTSEDVGLRGRGFSLTLDGIGLLRHSRSV